MNPEQQQTRAVLSHIEKVIGTPVKRANEKMKAEWRGENLTREKASALQNKVEQFVKTPDQAERDFESAVGLIGVLQQGYSPDNLSNKVLHDWFSQIVDRSPSPSFRELDIKTEYISSFDEANPKFREKAVEYLTDFCKDNVLAYFFYKSREGTAVFDRDKEFRQMRAVYHMEMGDHVAMNTGDGKTSVVIPAYSIYTSLFQDRKGNYFPNSIVSSADSSLTADVKKKIEVFKAHIESHIPENVPPEAKAQIKYKVKTLSKEREIDDEVEQKKDDPVEDLLSQPQKQLLWLRSNLVNLGTLRHEQAVFETTDLYTHGLEDSLWSAEKGQDQVEIAKRVKEKMAMILPETILDEAHLVNETPYVREIRKEEPNGKVRVNLDYIDDRHDLLDYLIIRMEQDRIFADETGNLTVSGQRRYLTGRGKKEIAGLRSGMIADLKAYFAEGAKGDVFKALNKIVREEVKPVCDFEKGQNDKALLKHLLEYIDRKGSLNSAIKSVGATELDRTGVASKMSHRSEVNDFLVLQFEDFANTVSTVKKGVHYLTPDLLRDSLRGTIMRRHRFSGRTPFYVNLNEKKTLVGGHQDLKSQIFFPTWLKIVSQGKVIALSNDLFYTDPFTGKREVSPLGKILETYTEGKVIDLAPKTEVTKVLPIPEPAVLKSEGELVSRLTKDIRTRHEKGNKQQELVVCWDELTGSGLYESLQGTGLKTAYISSETTDEQADRFHEQLANGELDILVTTGRKGFGADFKNKKGEFTDLRVNVVNPETVFQVAQAFGRRRLPKVESDFSIYFDQDFILPLGSILDQEKPAYFFGLLGKKGGTYPELENLVQRASGSRKPELTTEEREKMKKIIFEALKKNQNKQVLDWERDAEYESLFIETIAPRTKKMKRDVVQASWEDNNSPISQIIAEETEKVLSEEKIEDLPDELRSNLKTYCLQVLLDHFSTVEESIYEQNLEIIKTAQRDAVYAGNLNAQKGFIVREMEDLVANHYLPNLAGDLIDGESKLIKREIRPQIKNSLSLYAKLYSFMGQEPAQQGIGMEEVEGFQVLNAPYYEIDQTGTRFIPNPDHVRQIGNGQKIVVKDNLTYVYDEPTRVYWPVQQDRVEAQMALLNGIDFDYFKGKKYRDIYYQGDNVRKFVRVLLK